MTENVGDLINNLLRDEAWAEAFDCEVPASLVDDLKDAIEAIEELSAKLAWETKEKKAAVEDMEFLMRQSKEHYPCFVCKHKEYCYIRKAGVKTFCWSEWRGVQEEEANE